MSTHHTEEPKNTKTNFQFRIVLAFVYAIALAGLLYLLVGTQACAHCTKCSNCEECENEHIAYVAKSGLWGAEAGECKSEGACCKSKDKCVKEHECNDEEKSEEVAKDEKNNSEKTEKAEEAK